MKRILTHGRICFCLSLVGAVACPILFGWKGALLYIWTLVWAMHAGYWFAKHAMLKMFTEQATLFTQQIYTAQAQVAAATKESADARAKVDAIVALLSAKQKAN